MCGWSRIASVHVHSRTSGCALPHLTNCFGLVHSELDLALLGQLVDGHAHHHSLHGQLHIRCIFETLEHLRTLHQLCRAGQNHVYMAFLA
jgi:hypothetical protein